MLTLSRRFALQATIGAAFAAVPLSSRVIAAVVIDRGCVFDYEF